MPRVNLLYVITQLELGGAQKQLLLLIKHLDKEKFNVFLLTSSHGLLLDEAAAIKELKLKTVNSLTRLINPIKDLLAFIEIRQFIKRNKIHIVHTHSSKAGILGRWAARLAGVRIIIHTVHGWSFHDYQNFFFFKLFIFVEKLTATITDCFIVVSEFDRAKGLDWRISKEEKFSLIRYGINRTEFLHNSQQRDRIRDAFAIKADELLIGMVACFKPQKAVLDFIRVALLISEKISQCKFLLVGDGVLKKRAVNFINHSGFKEHFILLGWRHDVAGLLSAMDIFMLTSLWEGVPVAALEAMTSGKPVLATNTGGINEIIKDGENGFLVDCHDIKALEKTLSLLIQNNYLRISVGNNAKKVFEKDFTIENTIKLTQGLYDNLIKKRGFFYAN